MRKTYLGELEEVVLLTVALLHSEQAYGVLITKKIAEFTGRDISISAIHATLHRLEEKGFLKSETGGATQERGGRSKRFFELTGSGGKAIREIQDLRNQFWSNIPAKALLLKFA